MNYLFRNQERLELIDVTIPLRFYITRNVLELQAPSKENLIGFMNPCRKTTINRSLFIK